MKNAILKDIMNYAIQRLNGAYGYCGVAEREKASILNSDDRQGNDIKITIKFEAN